MNTIAMLCGYLVVILFALYTFFCFTVFRRKDKEKQERIFTRQRVCVFLVHFVLSALVYMIDFNITVLFLYAAQLLFFIVVICIYQIIYTGLSKLVLNNMIALMSISFVILERIDIASAGKQFMYSAAGMGLCLLVPWFIKKFPFFDRLAWVYAAFGLVFLAALLFVGSEVYGAKNWLNIGGILLQPLEFVKILFVFFIAAALAKGTGFKRVAAVSVAAGMHVIILVLEKDLGGALIYFITYLIILVVASGNIGYLFAGLGAGAGASLAAYKLFAHVRTRVIAWRDPWNVIDGAGYQITQSLFAIATGGWFGLGLGQGMPSAIPVVKSDFVFAAITEELGGVFAICLLLVYISCFIMFVNISMKIKVPFYKLAALGLGVMFIFQVFLAVGGVIKLIPSTGVTLPLISYGGSSMLGTIILFSIIQGMYVLYGSETVHEHEEYDNEKNDSLEPDEIRIQGQNQVRSQDRYSVGGDNNVNSLENFHWNEDGSEHLPEPYNPGGIISSDVINDNRQNKKKDKKKEKKEKKRSRLNRRITVVSYVGMGIMLCVIGCFTYFLSKDNSEILSNPYNKLQNLLAEHTTRGKIISSDGKVLAETVTDKKGKETRYYPYSNMFAHSVGHFDNGKTGIEMVYNYYMLRSSINPVYAAMDELQGNKKPGDNVISTLNYELQKIAYEALGKHKGAVIAIDPDTGNVLVMVSKQDYDPNFINTSWKSIINDDDNSPLLNRATQGLYPPGSTFKTVTLLEYLREHPDYKTFSFDCDGSEEIGGLKINCYNKKKHGSLDLKSAFAKSCNGAFAVAGSDLSVKKFKETCDQLLFNNDIECDFAYKYSSFSLKKKSEQAEKAQTAIGQGKTLMTPFHNAVITCAVANGGYYVKAHTVDRIESSGGRVVKKFHRNKKEKLMSEYEASVISKYMRETVKSGTATALLSNDYDAFGKTGSAEFNSSGSSHAWFTGYAKSGSKKIVVSIIVEGAGTGSDHAVPIAGKIFDAYY